MGAKLTTCSRTFPRLGESLLCWMGSYLTGRTQRVKLEDYLSESIQCHSTVPQGSHLRPIFFILDINRALDLFENVSVLGYAKCIGDCQLFKRGLDRLGKWCRRNKFDLNSGKCKSIYPSAATLGPLNLFIRLMGRRSKGLMRSKTLE
jgi:hypothetical protein